MTTAHVSGIESEAPLGYAALHRLIRFFPGAVDRLPPPQRDALRTTFGLVFGPPPDRFRRLRQPTPEAQVLLAVAAAEPTASDPSHPVGRSRPAGCQEPESRCAGIGVLSASCCCKPR
jgi:hypothetical protein